MSQFQGLRSPEEVLAELERKRKCRVDTVLSSDQISFSSVGGLQITVKPKGVGDVAPMTAPMTQRATAQLFDLVGLPQRTRCAQWLMKNSREFKHRDSDDWAANHDVLCHVLNQFFTRTEFFRLVRLMSKEDGTRYCRAILSNRYRIVDSHDLFFAITEELSKVKLGGKSPEIWHARLSEDHFFGYAVAPGLTGQVDHSKTDGERWKGLPGDTYNAAIVFGNSETGAGGVFVRHAIVRQVSRSYVVGEDLVSERHVGGRLEADVDLSAETIKAWNRAFFSEIKDHVRNAFEPERFQAMIDRLNGAAREGVEDGVGATDALQVCYDLSEATKTRVRNMFFKNGDLTRYGLVTAVAEAACTDVGAEEASALEQVSCKLASSDMAEMYKQAATNRESKVRLRTTNLGKPKRRTPRRRRELVV